MSNTSPYDAVITELFALSDACRDWSKFEALPADVREEFKRLAEQLDDDAKRLCETWTEALP